MAMKMNSPELVQYAISGSMCPTVVAASAPPRPASAAAMTYFTCTARPCLHQQAVQDHRQREAQQAEEDAAVAREQEAEHEGGGRGDGAADQHLDEDVRDAEKPAQRPGRICPKAIEECLAERDEPG